MDRLGGAGWAGVTLWGELPGRVFRAKLLAEGSQEYGE